MMRTYVSGMSSKWVMISVCTSWCEHASEDCVQDERWFLVFVALDQQSCTFVQGVFMHGWFRNEVKEHCCGALAVVLCMETSAQSFRWCFEALLADSKLSLCGIKPGLEMLNHEGPGVCWSLLRCVSTCKYSIMSATCTANTDSHWYRELRLPPCIGIMECKH